MGLKKWTFTEETPLDEKVISEVELLFGVKLPEDYKQCIKENNGGYPEPNAFDWDDGSTGSVFNNLISFTNKDLNIKMFAELSEQRLFPIADDPFGNLICFDYRYNERSPKIVFYDHEEQTICLVCDSFIALLERLYE